MKLLRRAVILSHRYLGIVLSLLVIMWFATGITMMYWGGMPRVTPELRLERLPPVDFSRVQMSPAEAAERAGFEPRGRVTLTTLLDRPVFRFGSRDATVVFADTGELLEELSIEQSQAIAAAFAARLSGGPERHAIVPASGIPLHVELPGPPAAPRQAVLEGEARVVFTGELPS